MKFSMRERWADFAIGIVPLTVYLLTLAPTITWRNDGADSGDLVSAAFTLGIPHPSGYPLYTLLAAIFSHLPFGEPAKNVSALSAVAAVGAIIFLARAGQALLQDTAPLTRWIPPSVALAFAFAPAFWSQATIAEVNALSAFFVTALFVVLFSDSLYRLELSALIFGFGLAHHLSLVLLLPSAIILLGSDRYTRTHYLRALICAVVPFALYFYLPFRAAAHPPVNWGDPETFGGFFWVVSGAPYRQYAFAAPPAEILTRVGFIARFLVENFTAVGVVLGVWGAVRTSADAPRHVFSAQLSALALPVIFTLGYNSRDSFVYLMPAYIVFAFWVMWGTNDVILRISQHSARMLAGGTQIALLTLLVLLPVYNLMTNFDKMNVSADYSAYAYAQNILANIPNDGVVIADGDEHYFALQYYRYVITPEKKQVIVSAELLQYAWYFDNIRWVVPGVNAAAANHLERVAEIMDASLAQGREVYTTVQNEAFDKYALERRDSYYRVQGRLP